MIECTKEARRECPYSHKCGRHMVAENSECAEFIREVMEAEFLRQERKAIQEEGKLARENAALLAALKKCDLDCDYCKHNTDNDGRCIDPNVDYEHCEIDCPCRSCVDMNKWEWRGLVEEVTP